jgi:hypothetical protein
MGLREIRWEGVDCMHVAEDRDHWQALVNTLMNPGMLHGVNIATLLPHFDRIGMKS